MSLCNNPQLVAAQASALDALPAIPRDAQGPVFAEPWEAQVFAMTLALHQRGVFAWSEWAAHLSAAIADARAAGDPDLGDSYYSHWLGALEQILASKGVAAAGQLQGLQQAWRAAADSTPHGRPITLSGAAVRSLLG